MLFCSEHFFVFFLVVFFTYWAMPWKRGRVWLLLVASFYFYASWNHWLALLICVTTAMDYVVARAMDAMSSQRGRKVLLVLSLIVNLGLLAYFKYANFFLQSVEDALKALGRESSMPVLSVILPIGISFYTFEAINYTVDVYRRRAPAERNLANFMLFITFFPHLVAGPIVRARDFLPQIERNKRWDWARMQLGAQYFFMGMFKKMVIADRMAMFADPVFATPQGFSSTAVWIATLAYAMQIYCDFSGYTDMALGTAHMLGYKLAQNFNMPYLATNISDFWRRWHMSLSTWLRDYLFIPLGGSRGGTWSTIRNLMITMTLGGLWHGASWTFVVWGVVHGLLLSLHRLFRDFCEGRPFADKVLKSLPGTILSMALTFLCVILCWVLFRATTFTAAMQIFRRLIVPHKGWEIPYSSNILVFTLVVTILAHVLAASGMWKKMALRLPPPVLGFGYAVVILVSLLLAPEAGKAFIYFQF